jgi:hypothetical protein
VTHWAGGLYLRHQKKMRQGLRSYLLEQPGVDTTRLLVTRCCWGDLCCSQYFKIGKYCNAQAELYSILLFYAMPNDNFSLGCAKELRILFVTALCRA